MFLLYDGGWYIFEKLDQCCEIVFLGPQLQCPCHELVEHSVFLRNCPQQPVKLSMSCFAIVSILANLGLGNHRNGRKRVGWGYHFSKGWEKTACIFWQFRSCGNPLEFILQHTLFVNFWACSFVQFLWNENACVNTSYKTWGCVSSGYYSQCQKQGEVYSLYSILRWKHATRLCDSQTETILGIASLRSPCCRCFPVQVFLVSRIDSAVNNLW